ncbi:MAG: PepSY domain-containing protein [Sphingobium sp.]|nr:PepSY domain-containing protein [Sphingobium sp.]
MNTSFRQSMASLHTWAGLLPGWLLYIVFLFGTTAYFQQEISRWMRPEMSGPLSLAAVLPKADALLHEKALGASEWTILFPARSGQVVRVLWEDGQEGSAKGKVTLDPATGQEVSVRGTQGGSFLYSFHYNLYAMPYLWARIAICIATLAMLVAILSGVITHKKIFADFFLLRFGKGQRSWLDAHNVTAVLALPFHMMITYTGLVTLLFTVMPWAISANFADRSAFYDAAYPDSPKFPPSGEGHPTLPLPQLIHRAQSIWAEAGWTGTVGGITIINPGDANATASLYAGRDRLAQPASRLILSATDGRLLYAAPPEGSARLTQSVMILLHLGTFADISLRWLYFLSGVGGTVMVASGLVLWTVKRRAKLPDPARPYLGFRLVERLNIGVITGSMAGIAVYFLANRLLPLAMTNRADWEINSLFIAWGGVFVWAMARPAKRAWVETLAACAMLYALVSIINAITTERGLIPSLIAGNWVFAGFDLVMLATAAACAFTAWKVAAHKPKAAPRRKARISAQGAL